MGSLLADTPKIPSVDATVLKKVGVKCRNCHANRWLAVIIRLRHVHSYAEVIVKLITQSRTAVQFPQQEDTKEIQ